MSYETVSTKSGWSCPFSNSMLEKKVANCRRSQNISSYWESSKGGSQEIQSLVCFSELERALEGWWLRMSTDVIVICSLVSWISHILILCCRRGEISPSKHTRIPLQLWHHETGPYLILSISNCMEYNCFTGLRPLFYEGTMFISVQCEEKTEMLP